MGNRHVLLFELRLGKEEGETGKGCEDKHFREKGKICVNFMFMSMLIYIFHLQADKSQKHYRKG